MDKSIKFHVLALFSIIVFCVALCPITLQNDTFYTIKIGEHILEHGIDMQDPFSWHEGLTYTYPHWLYDVTMFLIFKLAGFFGIYLSTVIFSSILGTLLYFTIVKRSQNNLVSFLLTVGAMYLLRNFIAARAQLITFILFNLTLYCIETFLDTKKKRYAIGLIAISILMANLHVAVWPFFFVIFLPYIGEYAIASIPYVYMWLDKQEVKFRKKKIEKLEEEEAKEKQATKIKNLEDRVQRAIKNRETVKEKAYKLVIDRNQNVKWLVIIMLICVFTGLLTPIGDTPYTYLIKTMQGNTTASINEHLPMTPIDNKEFLFVCATLFAILIFTDTKMRLSEFFLVGGLFVLTLKTRRQMSMLVLLGIFAFGNLICRFLGKYDKERSKVIEAKMVSLVRKDCNFSSDYPYQLLAIQTKTQ